MMLRTLTRKKQSLLKTAQHTNKKYADILSDHKDYFDRINQRAQLNNNPGNDTESDSS